MIFVPYEKLNDQQCLERNHRMIKSFGSEKDGRYDLGTEGTVKELIQLFREGKILEPLEFGMYVLDIEPLMYYKLILKLTSNNKRAREIFLNSWGTLDDKKSAINMLMQ